MTRRFCSFLARNVRRHKLLTLCFKNVTSQGTSYLCTRCSQWVPSNILVFKTLWIIEEPMAGSVPHTGRHHSHMHIAHRIVTPTLPPCQTRRSIYFSGMPMASATTDGTKHLPGGAQRQCGGHSGVQAHGTIDKSQHPNLHPSTKGSKPTPSMRLTVFIHNSSQFHSQGSVNTFEE